MVCHLGGGGGTIGLVDLPAAMLYLNISFHIFAASQRLRAHFLHACVRVRIHGLGCKRDMLSAGKCQLSEQCFQPVKWVLMVMNIRQLSSGLPLADLRVSLGSLCSYVFPVVFRVVLGCLKLLPRRDLLSTCHCMLALPSCQILQVDRTKP